MDTDVFPSKEQTQTVVRSYCARVSAAHHINYRNIDDWKKRRTVLRKQIMQSIGLDPLPQRLPLNVTYGGSIEHSDYTLKRVYYQSWPKMYASGWLYMPKSAGKHPAVLNPHGHWEHSAMEGFVQERCIALAKKGYVALCVDAVHQFPLSWPQSSHVTRRDSYLIGVSSLTSMIWNNIRGVDLLVSLPEVDPDKIGCTGASGGGQQTMYMMAVDDRIKAAVPAILISYFHRISYPEFITDDPCNWSPGILQFTDEPEIAAMFAPSPALFICTTMDWTASFPKEEYPEIKSIYDLYGATDRVDCSQYDWGHEYSKAMRERMYAWFNKWLKGIDDPKEAVEPEIQIETFEKMSSLNRPPADAIGFDQLPTLYGEKFHFVVPRLKSTSEWKSYQKKLRVKLADLLGDVKVKGALAFVPKEATIAGMQAEKLLIQSELDVQVPALLLKPSQPGKHPVAVLLHTAGKRVVLEERIQLVKQLVDTGIAVLLPDVRMTGELVHPIDWFMEGLQGNMAGWGRPEPGMALTDLDACLDVLTSRVDIDSSHIALAALKDQSVTALLAGALDPRWNAVVVEDLGLTYDEGRWLPMISNIKRLADLPQIASAIAPRPLIIGGSVHPALSFTKNAYTALGAESQVQLYGVGAPLPEGVMAEYVMKCLREQL